MGPDRIPLDAEKIEALRKEAHDAPMNKVYEDHDGHRHLGSHSTAWAEAGRRYADAVCQNAVEAAAPAVPEGVEPVGYLFRLRYGPDRWSHQLMFSDVLPTDPNDVKEVCPLYPASALSAQAAEIERLQADLADWKSACLENAEAWGDEKARAERAEAALAAAKRRIEELEAGRDALAAHVHFLRDALWVTNKSIWRDVKLSASAQDALDALESWEDHLVSEWIEVLDGYDVETKALPKGHETPSLGCSSYNWRTQIVGELRKRFEAMRRTPHGVAGGEEVADGYKAGE